jgi:hypothetical protein
MPRCRVLTVLTALCLSIVVLGACGSSREDPQQVLSRATFEGVESADFDSSLEIQSKGGQAGSVEVDLSGRVQGEGVAVTTKVAGTVQGKPVDFEGGLTLLDDHGFVNYKGTDYEIDPGNYSFAKPLFFPALAEERGTELAACKAAASEIKAGDLAADLHHDGTAVVAGTDTTKISGELDAGAAGAALVSLAEDPGCSAQFEALSPFALYKVRQLADEFSGSVESAEVEIYVGDDDIVRRVSAEFTGDLSGGEPASVDLDLTLSEVNANRKIEVPSGAKPVLVLFGKLGINPFEFLSWSRGGEGIRSLGEKVAADAFPSVEN